MAWCPWVVDGGHQFQTRGEKASEALVDLRVLLQEFFSDYVVLLWSMLVQGKYNPAQTRMALPEPHASLEGACPWRGCSGMRACRNTLGMSLDVYPQDCYIPKM